MSSSQPAKKQRTHPTYELLYHPGIPGRAEFIRLAFEIAGVPYVDVANEDAENGYSKVQTICMQADSKPGSDDVPVFAPPALRVKDGANGKDLVISQTPNILFYLGEKLGLFPRDAERKWEVQQIVLTALDLNDEVHDTHHPIASALYYEDQKDEALRKAKDVREVRIPKFYAYFSRQLAFNGGGKYLVGDGLTYADTTVWHLMNGIGFAFPKETEHLKKGKFRALFEWYEGLKEEEEKVKAYLESGRRLPFSQGVFRHYPELDRS